MSVLTEQLTRLEEWLRRSADAPTWTGVRFVESRSIQYGPIDTIPRSALRTVEAFEPRFEALFGAGYGWINLASSGSMIESHASYVARRTSAAPRRPRSERWRADGGEKEVQSRFRAEERRGLPWTDRRIPRRRGRVEAALVEEREQHLGADTRS